MGRKPAPKRAKTTESPESSCQMLPEILHDNFAQELAQSRSDIESEISSDDDVDDPTGTDPDSNSDDTTSPSPVQDEQPVRKRGRPRKGSKAKEAESKEAEEKSITYSFFIYSRSQLAKPMSKREAKRSSMVHDPDTPWDTIKAQVLVHVDNALQPKKLDFAHYAITATASRFLPKPGLPVASEAEYTNLIKRALTWKTAHPTINLQVDQTISPGADNEKENVDEDGAKATKKKANDPAQLPGNQHKLENIHQLKARWTCKKATDTCAGAHCYVHPETSVHIPLTHEMVDCWASAMLQGPSAATLEKPPNHHLFNRAMNPVTLERRLNTRKAEQPVVNVSISPELLGRAPLPPPDATENISASILPSSRAPGLDMNITAFCDTYNLDASILQKFTTHAFKEARHLQFVTKPELKDMGFAYGEIAATRDAVLRWSVAKDI